MRNLEKAKKYIDFFLIFSYNWLEHDAYSFGTQQIVDIHHIINISFVKPPMDNFGGDWTVRISAVSRNSVGLKKRFGYCVKLNLLKFCFL